MSSKQNTVPRVCGDGKQIQLPEGRNGKMESEPGKKACPGGRESPFTKEKQTRFNATSSTEPLVQTPAHLMPSPLADHGRATCRVGPGQLFIAYENRDCVLNGSEMDCVSNPVVKPLAMAWAAAKLWPQNDLPLTSILHHCLSPSHLTPNLFISGAFLLLRTETLGHL